MGVIVDGVEIPIQVGQVEKHHNPAGHRCATCDGTYSHYHVYDAHGELPCDEHGNIKRRSTEPQALAERLIRDVMSQREEICRAFVAKHGCDPDEVEQVEQQTETGRVWYLRKREPQVQEGQ